MLQPRSCCASSIGTSSPLCHLSTYCKFSPKNSPEGLVVANTLTRCFLDRTNIGNARLDHLEQDLKLHGLQYNDCLAVLFPFYIAAEIPSNIMMKRTRPSIWLTFIMFFWSAAMIAQGFVKDYSGLMATRVFLGVFEGGVRSSILLTQSHSLTNSPVISRCELLHHTVVCKTRMWLSYGAVLLCCDIGRRIRRHISSRHCGDVWSRWSICMVLDM